jgi:hypothetical protein
MLLSCVLVVLFLFSQSVLARTPGDHAGTHHQHHDQHTMDVDGMVMNENTNQLPKDCDKIASEEQITVRAGKKYAQQFNGTMFSYDQREWQVPPCAKVTVTLINEDNVRHQWMIHGLPRYLYPEGMFHLEANGAAKKSGTLIVPSGAKTYLVHCDVAQHTEKGMKAQLKVGGGNGNLPSIPGLTAPRKPDVYGAQENGWVRSVSALVALIGAALVYIAIVRIERPRVIQ